MKSDGSGARQATEGIPVLSYPAWHPDGRELAFVAQGANGYEILISGVREPFGVRKLAFAFESGSKLPHSIDYPFKEFLYRIGYNPAGNKITFESNVSGNLEIWVMNSDGSDMSKITKGDKPHWNPVWSPDGKKIAYATEKFASNLGPPFWPASNYNIWLADMSTGKEEALTAEEQTDWNPAWSPDGKKIAYVTNRSGNFKHFSIWLLDLK